MSNNILLMERRQLIPRWHTAKKSLSLQFPTLGSKGSFDSAEMGYDPWLEEAREDWKKERNIFNATELNVSLFMKGCFDDNDYTDTLSFLLVNYKSLPRGVAEFVSSNQDGSSVEGYSRDLKITDINIAKIKSFLKRNPRDVFSWVDLAFYYTVRGEDEKAYKCLRVAWGMHKSHPFVARSFARFLVHKGSPEEALWVLNKSGGVKHNPLLASAHLSVAHAFDLPGIRINDGRKLLKNFSGDQASLSDLAASLGTVDFQDGNIKRAKRFFETAMLVPSENALSQYGWLQQKYGFSIDEAICGSVTSVENDANKYYVSGDFSNCRDKLIELYSFQPFSDAPIVDAGYMSIMALKDPAFVINFSENRIPRTHMSFGELNNLVVAKLMLGDFDNLEVDFRLLGKKADKGEREAKGIFIATSGLMMFKMGDVEKGAELYESAIAFFRENRKERAVAMAQHFYSQNVKFLNPARYNELRAEIEELVKKHKMKELLVEW